MSDLNCLSARRLTYLQKSEDQNTKRGTKSCIRNQLDHFFIDPLSVDDSNRLRRDKSLDHHRSSALNMVQQNLILKSRNKLTRLSFDKCGFYFRHGLSSLPKKSSPSRPIPPITPLSHSSPPVPIQTNLQKSRMTHHQFRSNRAQEYPVFNKSPSLARRSIPEAPSRGRLSLFRIKTPETDNISTSLSNKETKLHADSEKFQIKCLNSHWIDLSLNKNEKCETTQLQNSMSFMNKLNDDKNILFKNYEDCDDRSKFVFDKEDWNVAWEDSESGNSENEEWDGDFNEMSDTVVSFDELMRKNLLLTYQD